MNKLQELQAAMKSLLEEIKGEADVAKKSALVTKAEALRDEIDTETKSAKLIEWAGEEKGGKLNWSGERKGTDLVGIDEKGNLNVDGLEGDLLSEKAWKYLLEPSYKSAFLRCAADPDHLDGADRKTLTEGLRLAKNFQEGLDPAGGYLVPGDFMSEIVKRDIQPSGVVDLVRTIPVGSDKLTMPRLDYQGATDDTAGDIYDNPMRIQWTGEAQKPGTTVRPNIGQIEIPVYEGQFEMPYSRSLADDAGGFFGDFLQEELRNAYRMGMENVILNGNGVAKPAGILFNPGAMYQPPTVNTGNPTTAAGLSDWIYSLPAQYATADCVWLADRVNTFRTWVKITDPGNHLVFGLTQTTAGGLATPRVPNLFGFDGVFSPFLPTPGAAANVGVFGNFRRGYYMAQRLAMQVRFQDLPREAFAYAVVRMRVGGQVVQGRALRVAVQS